MIPPSTDERNMYIHRIKRIIKTRLIVEDENDSIGVIFSAKNKLHKTFIDEQAARLIPDYLKGKLEISTIIVAPDAGAFERICNYGG